MPALTLVLGGARSGKSRYAEGLVTALPPPWAYIATAQAFDEEMRARIAEHRLRRGAGWSTREAPLDLPQALREASGDANAILVDCLTLWLSNLILADRDIPQESAGLEEALGIGAKPVVLVSNEVGLGIVPETQLGRWFRDEAGRLHQRLAARADSVLFMVAGIPMKVK